MQRVPHDENGVWIQQFKHINNNPQSSRYYLDEASFLNYTVTLSVDDETEEVFITHTKAPRPVELEISFGQFLTQHRNLEVFKKFYFDYNISINKRDRYTSTPADADSFAQIVVQDEPLSSFLGRNNYTYTGADFDLSYPSGVFRLFFGFNRVMNFKTDITPIKIYEGIVSEIMADVSDDCFTWIEIKEGYLDLTGIDLDAINYHKSSALLLDYKIVLNLQTLDTWLRSEFTYTRVRELLTLMGTAGIDITLMMYPPVASGMQLEDKPRIVAPNGILKTRLVPFVEFLVSRSFVEKAQKIFEVYFIDKTTNEVIYRTDSLESSEAFTLVGKNINIEPEYLLLENNIFEDLSGIEYPSDKFRVKYTLPNDLKKYLANHLDYTILVRITDLTSEREI